MATKKGVLLATDNNQLSHGAIVIDPRQ
jgi:hypothetical protein